MTRSGELRAHFDRLAARRSEWVARNHYYYDEIARFIETNTLPTGSILEVGCGTGELLARLPHAERVGVDFSEAMVRLARERHPQCLFAVCDAARLCLDRTFDYVLLSDTLGHLEDIQGVLEEVRRCCHPRTRLIINSFNHLWRPLLALGEWLGLKMPEATQNWLNLGDIDNFLGVSGFERVRAQKRMLLPRAVPGLAPLANRLLAHLPGLRVLGLVQYVIARPLWRGARQARPSLSVVVPARNEAGTIEEAVRRIPELGEFTEIIFVEGHSSDDTAAEIERIAAEWGGRRRIRYLTQPGRGKGDAVRAGFAVASGEIVTILDADLTVPPEELARFYRLLASGRGEFINGCRLIYPMEDEAMRVLNMVGNKLFGMLFSWLLDQPVRDTLCGTKMLLRSDYERIAAARDYFGDLDPFGDFDLLFGATRLNLKIRELPIRYRERVYGATNIDRWRHGLLLARMSLVAMRRIKLI